MIYEIEKIHKKIISLITNNIKYEIMLHNNWKLYLTGKNNDLFYY